MSFNGLISSSIRFSGRIRVGRPQDMQGGWESLGKLPYRVMDQGLGHPRGRAVPFRQPQDARRTFDALYSAVATLTNLALRGAYRHGGYTAGLRPSIARSLHRAGNEARLPDGLASVQASVNEGHRRNDETLENAVVRWLRTAPPAFTLTEATEGCGLADEGRGARVSMRDQRRLGAALTAAGCSKARKRVGTERRYVWERRETARER